MKLLGAKVRYKNPKTYLGVNPKDSILYKRQVDNMSYPIGFMTGDWFEVDKISGEFFDFKGSNRVGIIPFTIKQFSDDNWEWKF